jgi:hypothetical protein
MKFYRNEQIEQIAERRLLEFEQKLERPLSLPIDIELFGELVLDLSILWDEIEELPGEEVLAGLRVADRLIVMNEGRKLEMEAKAGPASPYARPRDGPLGSFCGQIEA